MVTLRDLIEVFWDITEIDVTARGAGSGKYLHEWKFGKDIDVSTHMRYAIEEGRLTVVDRKINAHGDPTRGGVEMGWGVKPNTIPKEILDATITHMGVGMYNAGSEAHVHVDVEMQPMTVEALKGKKL